VAPGEGVLLPPGNPQGHPNLAHNLCSSPFER
jgi:hypothetical protein